MIVANEKEIEGLKLEHETLKDVTKKVLVGPEHGWEGWVMRLFWLDPGGYPPLHKHPWPHINYAVKGKGILHLDGKEYDIEEGSYDFIPSNLMHQIRNNGDVEFGIICIVPEEGDI